MAGNKKATLADVATRLAERRNISRAEAQRAVESVFETLREGLADDGFVKASGLGTLKVATTAERESVSVQTGERIKIEAHERLSFAADGVLKGRVQATASQVAENEEVGNEENEAEEMLEVHHVELEERAAEVSQKAEGFEVKAENFEGKAENLNEEPDEKAADEKPEERKQRNWKGVLIVIVGLAVCLLVGYLLGKSSAGTEKNVAQTENSSVPLENEQEEAPKEPTIEELAAEYAQVEGGQWLIVGTIAEHTMAEGDMLQRLSDEIFRHPDYLRYVMVHNGLKQADVVPVGKLIRFPKLVAREKAEE